MEEKKIRELSESELEQVCGGFPELYVQNGDDWDDKDFNAVYIEGQDKEKVTPDTTPGTGFPLVNGQPAEGQFSTFGLRHF